MLTTTKTKTVVMVSNRKRRESQKRFTLTRDQLRSYQGHGLGVIVAMNATDQQTSTRPVHGHNLPVAKAEYKNPVNGLPY